MKPNDTLHRPILRTQAKSGFTIVEILIVLSIILVLAGLILSTAGYVQGKGARARAEAEISAFSAALESYKADNGIYPRDSNTDGLDPKTSGDPSGYKAASQSLYVQLSGDSDGDPTTASSGDTKNYLGAGLKPGMLNPNPPVAGQKAFFQDPFGFSYGYSTSYQADSEIQAAKSPPGTVTKGYNPTFDLWSTSGNITPPSPGSATDVTIKWVKNW